MKPTSDHILVRPATEQTKSGLLHIPETALEKPLRGKVMAVGPGKYEEGTFVATTLKVNDEVLYGKFAGHEVELDGEKLLVMREGDVLVVL